MPAPGTGLFGKLPAHGDFVRRGLPRGFVAAWDDWLSAGIAASRDGLGPGWEAAWEMAPAWRFRLAPGACGPDAAVGVMVTSADTVGRRFPLTLVAVTPDACPAPGEAWFAALEDAAARGRAGVLDADAVLALLPPPPPEDPDATLDGRNLFWTAGAAPIRMPGAADFWALLGEVPDRVAAAPAPDPAGLDAAAADLAVPGEAVRDAGLPTTPDADAVASDSPDEANSLPFAGLPFDGLPFDGLAGADLPFAAPATAAPDPDAAPDADRLPFADQAPEAATDDAPHIWAETVDLPWATAPLPRNPETGADA